MPTISAGSSQTFTAGVKDQLFTLTANGGALGTVTGAVSASFGPGAERRAFGPFAVGQAITVTVQAGSVIVEYGDATPENEGAVGSVLNGVQTAAGATAIPGVTSAGSLIDNAGVTRLAWAAHPGFTPWRVATYGDSRSNVNVGAAAASNAGYPEHRAAAQFAYLRGDVRLVFNGGVSGDSTANYNSASRISASQGVDACIAATPDMVIIQYGINDNIGGTASATTIGNLKALITEFLGAGIFVVFESINPCAVGPISYINGISSSGGYSSTSNQSEADTRLGLTTAVNTEMRSWLATFPGRALYVDTSAATTASSGFALADKTYGDGTHISVFGARKCGRILQAALAPYFPLREGTPLRPPNRNGLPSTWLNPTSGRSAVLNTATSENGTISYSYAVTTDEFGESVQEVTITPTALASGYWRTRLELMPVFVGASPAVSVTAGDLLQATVQIYADDGNGGAPSCFSLQTRPRIYYNDATNEYTECATAQTLSSTDANRFDRAEWLTYLHPTRAVKAAMSSATMLQTGGTMTALHILVAGNVLAPTRLRIKQAVWAKVTA